MHDLLWLFLSSLLIGWVTFKTRKEERFLEKKQVREIVKKYRLPAEFTGSSFIILLFLLAAAAISRSNGRPEEALFLGSLHTLALMAAASSAIHLLCRIRRGWDEHDFYIAMASCGKMSPRRMKQLLFFLGAMACSGLIWSSIRLLSPLL